MREVEEETERAPCSIENIVNSPVDRKDAIRRAFEDVDGGDWSTARAVM